MNTYRVGPTDFPIEHETLAYRISWPAGHLNFMDGTERFYPALSQVPAELRQDPLVKTERVRVLHTRVLDGGAGQAQLVQPLAGRIAHELNQGRGEKVDPASAQAKYPKWTQPEYAGE